MSNSRRNGCRTGLLSVEALSTRFVALRGTVYALNEVTFDIDRCEMVGLIGETGCGKSVTGLSILGLIRPPGQIVGGQVLFKEQDLRRLAEKEYRRVRGRHISMIFQRPMSSLNPVFTIGKQLTDVIRLHTRVTRRESRMVAVERLRAVAMPDPGEILTKYPHELSGGMQQRAMIAVALACGPELLIADEPTTALDVSVQLQILKLLKGITRDADMSILLISHDMGVIGSTCDRINVMYAGSIVEGGSTETILGRPLHPYSRALMAVIPRLSDNRKQRLQPLAGEVLETCLPPGRGCPFLARCPVALDVCNEKVPPRVDVGARHVVTCILSSEDNARSSYDRG